MGCACLGGAQAYWDQWHHYGLWKPRVVFTIHNAEYGLDRIAVAARYSQRITTVSPTYAHEVYLSHCCTWLYQDHLCAADTS